MDRLFEETDRYLEAVIYLKVPDEEIIKRLPGRVICRVCQNPYHLQYKPPAIEGICDVCRGQLYQRDDDSPDVVRLRLRTSHRAIDPVVDYYRQTGKLAIIDGTGTIDEVHQAIVETLDSIKRRTAQPASQEEVEQISALKGAVTALAPAEAPHRSLDIILLGGPGSGKGTQAEQLTKNFDLLHISTGNLFRENIENETDLGKLAKNYISRGELVPDDVTEAMVRERLARPDVQEGFVLDGFPRTIPQAEALSEIMTEMERGVDGVLHIKVSDDEIVKRLSGRRVCRNCQASYHIQYKPPQQEGICDLCGGELYQRDDDNPNTIRARLKTYKAQTAPLIGYYREVGLLVEIDGEQTPDQVTAEVRDALHNLKR